MNVTDAYKESESVTGYQLLPDLSDDEYDELKADIAERGVMVAVEYDGDGNLLDGHHRERACHELGIADYPSVVRYGLSKPWVGRVWMNPPYSADLVGQFTAMLTEEFLEGGVAAAIVLVNNATETQWFQRCVKAASFVCFPSGRIKYLHSRGEPKNKPLQGQAFLYFGAHGHEFCDEFSQFGAVVEVKS